MQDDKIHIPARSRTTTQKSEIIRVSAEAYNRLVEIYNESTLSLSQVASLLITEGADRVVYDKDGECE